MTADEARSAELEIRGRVASLCRDLIAVIGERVDLCRQVNFTSSPVGPQIPPSLLVFGPDETDVHAFVRAAVEAGLLS
jgi:hypothetical protein